MTQHSRRWYLLVEALSLGLLTFAATRLAVDRFAPTAQAQSACCVAQPPLETDYLGKSWPPGKSITVIAQDLFSPDEASKISLGIRSWNGYKTDNCSNVSFGDATRKSFLVTDSIPDYTIRVLKRNPNTGSVGAILLRKGANGRLVNADMMIHPDTVPSGLTYLGAHETGHTLALMNCNACPLGTAVMTSYNESQVSPTQCDVQVVGKIYCACPQGGKYRTCKECKDIGGSFINTCACPTPTPSPTPTPTQCPFCPNPPDPFTGLCPAGSAINSCGCCACNRTATYIAQCLQNGGEYDPDFCVCLGNCGPDGGCSPVLVDVEGDGFALTDAQGGVLFDLSRDGVRERLAWTAPGSDDAWLALDRNGNGQVDDGGELFGNYTYQAEAAEGEELNGFRALAEYDKAENGGNGDGLIDARDAFYASLRLWRDANHDGVSQPAELSALPELGVAALRLDYKESRRTDEHGNRFRYRAKVDDARGEKAGRWAWDVFLVSAR